MAVRSKLYWEHLCDTAVSFAPKLTPTLLTPLPVFGVALTVLKTISLDGQDQIRDRLFTSAEELGMVTRIADPSAYVLS